MGHDQSKNGPSLAEKRYKIERPPVKKRSKDKETPRIGKSSTLDGIKNGADTIPQCPVIITTNDESSMETLMDKSDISNGRVSPSPHPAPPKKHFLNRRERLMLEQSWKKTRKTGAEHVGSKIFFMVLTAQPDIKSIFGLEKIPQGRLKYDPRFRQHATVFTKTFDYVIPSLLRTRREMYLVMFKKGQQAATMDMKEQKMADQMSEDRVVLKFLHDAFYYFLLNKGDSKEHLQVIMTMLDFSADQKEEILKKKGRPL